jgi:hypothetical protein
MFPLDFHLQHKTTNRHVFRNSTFFNERIMMAIVQEDENSNTSRGLVRLNNSHYTRVEAILSLRRF